MSWRDLAIGGDYRAALAALAAEFRGREESLEATYRLAELHELWGDAEFFGAGKDGPPHYRHAMSLLFPTGLMFDNAEEHDRRMAAYSRMSDKIRSVNGYGYAREQDLPSCEPHPDFRMSAERLAEIGAIGERLAAEREAEAARPKGILPFTWPSEEAPEYELAEPLLPAPPPPRPVLPPPVDTSFGISLDRQPRAPEPDPPPRSPARRDGWAELANDDHWRCHSLGSALREAGDLLSEINDELAAEAYDRSLTFFEAYSRAWTANLPASRWDSDGGQEMAQVSARRGALRRVSKTVPPWVRWVFAGNWQRALAALPDEHPGEVWKPVLTVLAYAPPVPGHAEAERRLKAWLA